jgi:hypothetical protein
MYAMNMTHPDICHMERYGEDNAPAVCYCVACDEAICEGEDYYDVDGDIQCADCVEDNALTILADYFGCKKQTAAFLIKEREAKK